MKKNIVFVSLTFVVSSITSGQNKGPVHNKSNIDTLHHRAAMGVLKVKQTNTRGNSANKKRSKDSLKAMNDPMTKLEKPGQDSAKLSKPAIHKNTKLQQQKKDGTRW